MAAAQTERERLEGIAYLALWQLRDLNPGAEPRHFKRTRLDLHDRIGPEPEQPPPPKRRQGHLALVP